MSEENKEHTTAAPETASSKSAQAEHVAAETASSTNFTGGSTGEFTGEPNETAEKAHATGEQIGRAVTGVVVTGGSFIVGLAKGIAMPLIEKIGEVSEKSQTADIAAQANEAFQKGVTTAASWTGKTGGKDADKEVNDEGGK